MVILIPTGRRVRGKDVLLEKHAFEMMRKRGINLDHVLNIILHPSELYGEKQYSPLFKGMKRYVAVKYYEDDKVLIVVYDEDDNIIVITTWRMEPLTRYNKYKERKISSKRWVKIE